MLALLWLPDWLWHPLRGEGYQFWSGIGSDVGELTVAASVASLAAMTYRRHRCHADRCWRLAWHPHGAHGHPVCRRHHDDGLGETHFIHGFIHGREI